MKPFNRFTAKLVIVYLLSLCFLIFGWSVFGTRFFESRLIKNTKSLFYDSLSDISSNYMKGYYNDSLTNADLSFELDVMSSYFDCRIILAKSDGLMTYDSQDSVLVNLFDYKCDILSDTYCYGATLPGYIDDPFLSVSYPVTYDMALQGHIVMLKSCKDIFSEADAINTSYWPYILSASLLITLLFILAYIFTVKPLNELIRVSKEYCNKNYSYECKIRSLNEYRQIYDAFRCIAGDLNRLNDEQRKFISNISHDFRSPLTSIKGYAEAMVDGTIPPEMSEKYLRIILFETERLAKLTNGLLELTKIDKKQTFLDITPFDINASIKQTVACFEGICKEKKIQMVLIFEEAKTYVSADLGKIQQVLYNLIDNAIKFSHTDSKITIATTIKNDKIFVSVKDCGVGISKASLSKIWDRFYKADESRGKNKKGTGLGLSIVKEIIHAHNENITVTSTEGVGTEFTFSLPRKSV